MLHALVSRGFDGQCNCCRCTTETCSDLYKEEPDNAARAGSTRNPNNQWGELKWLWPHCREEKTLHAAQSVLKLWH